MGVCVGLRPAEKHAGGRRLIPSGGLECKARAESVERKLDVGRGNPHAHWMTHDGRTMVTASTLIGTITVVDTATDAGVNVLACDPGCHGVQFGAKAGSSGYYAYVSSKFSNTLPVVDADPNGDGNTEDAAVAGRVLLTASPYTATDDRITGNPGMGGQGVLAIPVVYNAWVQNLPAFRRDRLTPAQRDPTFAD